MQRQAHDNVETKLGAAPMIDDTGFGFLLIVGIVAIFLGGLVWHMLTLVLSPRCGMRI